MREVRTDVEFAKRKIGSLKNREIKFRVNTGRNKIIEYNGMVENLYPAIFTVRAKTEEGEQVYSYSYNEVLMRNVKFLPLK